MSGQSRRPFDLGSRYLSRIAEILMVSSLYSGNPPLDSKIGLAIPESLRFSGPPIFACQISQSQGEEGDILFRKLCLEGKDRSISQSTIEEVPESISAPLKFQVRFDVASR